MKLSPSLSYCAVLAAALAMSASGMTRHPDVSLPTYCDFGQNLGRFSVKNLNALQKKLAEKGITLRYSGGQPDFTLPHGMPSFESQGDNGAFAAIAPNAIATVQHNGVQNPTFTGRYLGHENSIHYSGIEYRVSEKDVFLLTPAADYKITRLNKLITDVTPAVLYPGTKGDLLDHKLIYRTGAGTQVAYDKAADKYELAAAPYVYITGGLTAIETTGDHNWIGNAGKGDDDSWSGTNWFTVKGDWLKPETAPLPFAGHEGDSGSPVWYFSEENNRFEFVATVQGMNGGGVTYHTMAPSWTAKTLDSFTKKLTLTKGQTAAITPVVHDTGRDVTDPKNNVTAHPYEGTVMVDGSEAARFVGLKQGTEYWKNFMQRSDTPDWFAYDPKDYTNPEVTIADLFLTENLCFAGEGKHSITVDDAVDMGIGYVELQGKGASFTLQGKGRLNTAGFIVGEGVTLKNTLSASDDVLREIRKVGPGTMVVAGEGAYPVNLMLGGGVTRLQRKGGNAAWNVHVANGSKLMLDGDEQVRFCITLGNGGGTVDLRGHDMNALQSRRLRVQTQDGTIANSKGAAKLILSTADLAKAGYAQSSGRVEPECPAYPASFADAAGASLTVVLEGDKKTSNETVLLSPTHTKLLQPGSGIVVSNGAACVLTGTYTQHGMGSATGKSAERLLRKNDRHFADAAANVTVDGGSFQLWSHARLKGTVTVKSGSSFCMCSPVEAAQEYIEGGETLEDTADILKYAGLKGDVVLESGAKMEMRTRPKAPFTYAGRVSAAAGSSVLLTGSGSLTLSGAENSFGTLEVNCTALENSALKAKKLFLAVGMPQPCIAVGGGRAVAGSVRTDKNGKKVLTVYAASLRGGSVAADELSIYLGDAVLQGQSVDAVEICLGDKDAPVSVGSIGKATLCVKHTTRASDKVKGTPVKNGAHTAYRFTLPKK